MSIPNRAHYCIGVRISIFMCFPWPSPGVELLVKLVATSPPQNIESMTQSSRFSPLGHTHSWYGSEGSASCFMSSSVTPAFSNLCPSNLWHYGELVAIAPLLTHFSFCWKKPSFGVFCVNTFSGHNSFAWLHAECFTVSLLSANNTPLLFFL